MTKRFGRNQKRKLREQIKDLLATRSSAIRDMRQAEHVYNEKCKAMDVSRYGTIFIREEDDTARYRHNERRTENVHHQSVTVSFDALQICSRIRLDHDSIDRIVTEIHGGLSKMIIETLYTKLEPIFEDKDES